MNNFLHLIVDTRVTNLSGSMIEGALKDYTYTQVFPGYWIVKTNQAPSEFQALIGSVVGSVPYTLFRTDDSALMGGAIVPENVRNFISGKQNAA